MFGRVTLTQSHPVGRVSCLSFLLFLGQPELSGHTQIPDSASHVLEHAGTIDGLLPTG